MQKLLQPFHHLTRVTTVADRRSTLRLIHLNKVTDRCRFWNPRENVHFLSSAIVYTTAQPIVSLGTVPFIGHDPVSLACLHCGKNVVTNVKYDPGVGTILMGGLICFFGGFLGCCFLPCCIPACQDATHRCPLCSSIVGHRKFL